MKSDWLNVFADCLLLSYPKTYLEEIGICSIMKPKTYLSD